MTDGVETIVFTETRSGNVVDPLDPLDNVTVVQAEQSLGSIRRYFRMIRRGYQNIGSEKPDVLFANRDGMVSFVTVLLGLRFQIPVVVRLGGDPWRNHTEKLYESLQDWAIVSVVKRLLLLLLNEITFARSKGFIVVSEELKQTVAKQVSQSSSQIRVVHSPVRSSTFPTDSTSNATSFDVDSNVVILTVTNLDYRGKFEGIRTTLTEIRDIIHENRDVAYVIAGDGKYHERLKGLVMEQFDRLATKHQIFLPGFVDSVTDLYSIADFFVYISYDDGYPNVVLEAQAAALPVITNDAHGMKEQIDDGKTGILVNPFKDGDIRRNVEMLLENQEKRRLLGDSARKKVEAENAAPIIGQQLMDAITDICVGHCSND